MKLTAYQLQYKRRIKKALALRARADTRARALATRLAAALADGSTAAARIGRLNTLYNTTVSPRTTLLSGFSTAGTAAGLTSVAAASVAGTPAVVYANIANGNGGAVLTGDTDLD